MAACTPQAVIFTYTWTKHRNMSERMQMHTFIQKSQPLSGVTMKYQKLDDCCMVVLHYLLRAKSWSEQNRKRETTLMQPRLFYCYCLLPAGCLAGCTATRPIGWGRLYNITVWFCPCHLWALITRLMYLSVQYTKSSKMVIACGCCSTFSQRIAKEKSVSYTYYQNKMECC